MTAPTPSLPAEGISHELRRAVAMLVVVIVVLTALAGIPGPRSAEDEELGERVGQLRTAIEHYARDHAGAVPGRASWSEFVRQLTTPTDADGRPGGELGPYVTIDLLRGGGRLVDDVPDAATGDCTWLWCPDEARLVVNRAGRASDGASHLAY